MLDSICKKASSRLRQRANKVRAAFTARSDMTNVYNDVRVQYSHIYDAARAFMEDFVRESTYFDIHMSPAQRFVQDQSFAYTKTILRDITNETMVTFCLREGMENIYFLGHLWKHDERIVKAVGHDLVRLLRGLGDLIESCERTCEIDITNWDAVSHIVSEELLGERSERVEPEESSFGTMQYLHLERLIGAGGFGGVYKATMGNAVCTVKLVPRHMMPDVEHAIADKEVATMINHPCLVRYHATFSTVEAFVTVMEYIRGVDVIRLLHLSTRLSDLLIRLILAQLALALCHLHFKGFIHRDVKPANMMITAGCRIKLIDFDTAKVCVGKFPHRALPSFFWRTTGEFLDGEIAGTISYMAPEMLMCKDYGRSVDWWSFGVTAYELAVGRRPFGIKDTTFEQQKQRICRGAFLWPNNLNLGKPLKKLVRSCLHKQLSQRFCSEGYTDIANHSYFSGLDLRWVETSAELLKFDPLTSVAMGQLTYDVKAGCQSPIATPSAAEKVNKLFPKASFTDTESQVKLFSYFSPCYREACNMIIRGETPSDEIMTYTSELVNLQEDVGRFFFSDAADSRPPSRRSNT